ncbi:MAG TPA: Flp family type IVb pilin [Acidobacteriaceae bacterium]|jgi:pilus assembly protein Flp/PilA|nr:Flp family type IVb pilin [Acidobacteriaceae bacterium]
MESLKEHLIKFVTEERGQDMIEYALVAALVGLGTLAGLRQVKNSVSTSFGQIGNTLNNSVT